NDEESGKEQFFKRHSQPEDSETKKPTAKMQNNSTSFSLVGRNDVEKVGKRSSGNSQSSHHQS
ncbi:hypothetical protein RUM43_009734, partial [Polyplax serrata]